MKRPLAKKVTDYVTNNGDWEEKLGTVLLEDCLELLITIKAPIPSNERDQIAWFPKVNGIFTLKTTY